jgi:predicted GNAT superfamily acetyltransferase
MLRNFADKLLAKFTGKKIATFYAFLQANLQILSVVSLDFERDSRIQSANFTYFAQDHFHLLIIIVYLI